MMVGYMEEFDGRDSPDWQQRFTRVFRYYYDFVEGQVREHWASVTALADRLLAQGRVTRAEALVVIERNLDGETKRWEETSPGEV
jgi:hypothetical protein